MDIIITNHAINRMKTRFNFDSMEEIKKDVENAFLNGQTYKKIKNISLKKYIKHKEAFDNVKIKVRKSRIYIFSKMKTKLITVYSVPKKLGGGQR